MYGPNSSAWSDGARPLPKDDSTTPLTPAGAAHPGGRYTGRITANVNDKVSRLMQFEGPRGYSTRAAVVLRYISYLLVVLLSCGITQAATNGIRNADGGGWFMLLACATVVVVGAASTLFYVNLRNTIINRVRHYVFGLISLPGVLVALFMKAAQGWLGTDTLGTTLGAALPIVFLATVILPAFVFMKEILGIRGLNNSKLDDEEAVRLWTRQDDLLR